MFRVNGKQGKSGREFLLFLLLLVGLLISMVATVSIGSTGISFSETAGIIVDKIFGGSEKLAQGVYSVPHFQIIWNIRLRWSVERDWLSVDLRCRRLC